jgi:Zn-dependent M28 family amino/carboxypeptidase
MAVLVFFICLSGCSSTPQFDGDSAFAQLHTQVAMGPRNPGSEGHAACRAYLIRELSQWADTVLAQDFELADLPGTLTNIVGRFNPDQEARLLLCAHWDTRPWADLDPDSANWAKPIPGANDGASGVAVLLELARILHRKRPKRGVDIVFFDAEDSGTSGNPTTFCRGSAYFADHIPAPRPRYGILVDMVGDRDLDIYMEQNSLARAPHVVELIWQYAAGSSSFHRTLRHSVYDDHMSLADAGIPCALIIDFDYPYWHTLDDTPDKCSPKSLHAVGEVLTKLVYR